MTFPALRRFQREFLSNALSDRYNVAAISIPRGNSKSFLASYILSKCLTPGDPLFEAGREYLLVSGSIEQARLVFRPLREQLETRGIYRWIDSATRISTLHRETNTKLRVLSSNPKTSLGIVNTPICVVDEPAAFEVVGGTALWDSLVTAMGKPNSRLKILLFGTIAPSEPEGLVGATHRGRYDRHHLRHEASGISRLLGFVVDDPQM